MANGEIAIHHFQRKYCMKIKASTVLKIIISFGLMAWLFYRFLSDPGDREILFAALSNARWGYMLLALIFFVLAILSNAYKWQILLAAQKIYVPFKVISNLTFVGFFFNNFLPANVGGDLMRGYVLARYTERTADAAVSVVVDRIIGLMSFMFTAVVAAQIAVGILAFYPNQNFLPTGDDLMQNLIYVELLATGGTLVIIIGFALLLSHRLRQFIGRLFEIRLLKPLAPIYAQVSQALGAYRHEYRALAMAFLVALLNPVLTGLVDISIVAGLNASINPLYIFLFNPIIAVLLIAPISIGGLGTGSWLYVYFYSLVGVSEALAFALSLVKQAIVYLGSLPGGLLWMRRERRQPVSAPGSEV